MALEQWLADLTVQLPNLAVALLVLYWQRKTIDELLEHQRQLVDRLLQIVDDVREISVTPTAPLPPLPPLPTMSSRVD